MDRDYELQTHRAEDRHWWYRGRRRVIERAIEGLRLPSRARILDAGCGSGRNMVELAGHGAVTGVELSDASVTLARARGCGEVVAGSVLEMPFAACDPCKCLLFHEGDVDGVACPHCKRQVSPIGIEEALRRLRRARARREKAASRAAKWSDGGME